MTSKVKQWLTAALVFGLFVVLLLFWGRCVWVNHAAAQAHLRLENHSPSGWRIEISTTEGLLLREVHLGPWERLNVPLRAGSYRLVQTLVDEQGADGAIRVLDADFAEGKTYDWPLVTLLGSERAVR